MEHTPAQKGLSPATRTIMLNAVIVFAVVVAANLATEAWIKPMVMKPKAPSAPPATT